MSVALNQPENIETTIDDLADQLEQLGSKLDMLKDILMPVMRIPNDDRVERKDSDEKSLPSHQGKSDIRLRLEEACAVLRSYKSTLIDIIGRLDLQS